MAKATAERTPKQKALDAASVAYDKALEADTKNSTAVTKKALQEAETVRRAAAAEVRRENFVRVAGNRVKKIIIAVRNLSGVNNQRTYSYTEADIAKAEETINARIKDTFAKMRAGLNTSSAAPAAKEEFTF